MTHIRRLAFVVTPLSLLMTACTVIPDTPKIVGTPLPEGSPVALDQPVRVAEIIATPKRIVEDSRCPVNARCAWAGRLIVQTRIDGDGWRDTADITLSETYGTHGHVVALVTGLPEKIAGRETPPGEYRFVYENRTSNDGFD